MSEHWNWAGVAFIGFVLFVMATALRDEGAVSDGLSIRNGAEIMWRVGHTNE